LTEGTRARYDFYGRENMEEMIYFEKPLLHKPLLIIGFEGWPNAADVSSSVLQYLIEKSNAKKFASIPNEDFYHLSSSRPEAVIKEGRLMELKFPGNHFYYSHLPFSKDFIFFYGVEPHLRWNQFVDLLLGLAETFGVTQLFTIGGTYDYIPHTCPPTVSALFNHEDLRGTVIQAGLELTDYTGPISIHTFIMEAAKKKGLKGVSLWGHAPQYLQTKNVKVVYAILRGLTHLAEVSLDLSEMETASEYFDQQVNHLVEQDPKLKEVITKLEEVYRQSEKVPPLLKQGEGSKEDKVVYIRAFLKRQEDEEKKER
jgi:proteasome assembly chaperone (PAC2) family protein